MKRSANERRPKANARRPESAANGSNGNPPMFIRITPGNVLSFGPNTPPLELRNLNVLIGPNGSGKSNLLDIISFIRAAKDDLRRPIERGGGVAEWIWKGSPQEPASIEVVVRSGRSTPAIRHVVRFRAEGQAFRLGYEEIDNEDLDDGQSNTFYRSENDVAVIRRNGRKSRLVRREFQPDLSVLSQLRDSEAYPEISCLVELYSQIRLYRDWTFGRSTVFRSPQKADLPNDRLAEDFSNLGLFLNRLGRLPKTRAVLLECLRDLYEGLTDFNVSIQGGTTEVFFTERDFTIPASRLSDGSLRYLCLIAILCDPEPPPLIGIEEPEIGLHPDLIHKIVDLMIAASSRTQLIVTTHSDILVDAVSSQPEAVVVCEKHDGQTVLQRLKSSHLKKWLSTYSLGELWTRGDLGGTRW